MSHHFGQVEGRRDYDKDYDYVKKKFCFQISIFIDYQVRRGEICSVSHLGESTSFPFLNN